MFTGLVEGTGKITRAEPREEMLRLAVDLGDVAEGVRIGDSISINGACLTVVELDNQTAAFDLVPETLSRTTLGKLTAGTRVNLERALRAGDRLGGHFVQGHVDAMGTIESLQRDSESAVLRISCDGSLVRQMIPKGSIAIDGVSLTLASLFDDAFEIALVPHTLEVTTLGDRAANDVVNIELDMLGKYVARLIDTAELPRSSAD